MTLVNSIDFLFHFLFGKAPDAVYLESKPLIVGMGELHQICNKNSEEIGRIQSNTFHSSQVAINKGKKSTLTEVDINSPV